MIEDHIYILHVAQMYILILWTTCINDILVDRNDRV